MSYRIQIVHLIRHIAQLHPRFRLPFPPQIHLPFPNLTPKGRRKIEGLLGLLHIPLHRAPLFNCRRAVIAHHPHTGKGSIPHPRRPRAMPLRTREELEWSLLLLLLILLIPTRLLKHSPKVVHRLLNGGRILSLTHRLHKRQTLALPPQKVILTRSSVDGPHIQQRFRDQ